MDQARASGAPLAITLGGTTRTLRRLSRRDFGTIIERMPLDRDRRMFVSVWDVHRWAATADGAPVVLAVASLPVGYSPADLDARIAETSSEIEPLAWGSKIQQSTVASIVTSESLISGEEAEVTGEGKQRSDPTTTETMPKRPD
jgi:hypothetical protein